MVDTQKYINTSNIKDCDKIQGIGFSSFIYPLMFTCFLGMATCNIFNIAKVDSYISVIIGSIIGIIPFLLVMYIIKNSDGKNILDLNISLFGKTIGTIFNAIINVVFLLFASLILYNLSLFLDTQYIPDTSSLYIKILIMLPVVYAASKSIATISRVSQIVLIANIILFLVSAIGLITEFDFNNLLPVLSEGIKPVFCGGLQYVIFAVIPLFLLTVIPTRLVNNKEHILKNGSILYIITNIIIFLIFFVTIGVLGIEVVSIYKYPEYMVLKNFSLFGIVERIENTLAIQFVFSMFVFITLIVYICSKTLSNSCKRIKSQQLFPTILGIVIIIISSYLFENSSLATMFISKYVPYIIGIVFGIIILVLCITIFIRNAMNKKSNREKIRSSKKA